MSKLFEKIKRASEAALGAKAEAEIKTKQEKEGNMATVVDKFKAANDVIEKIEKGEYSQKAKTKLTLDLVASYKEGKATKTEVEILKALLAKEQEGGKISTAHELLLNKIEEAALTTKCKAKVKVPSVLEPKKGDVFKYAFLESKNKYKVYVPKGDQVKTLAATPEAFAEWFEVI